MTRPYFIATLLLILAGCGSSDIRSLGDLGLSTWPQLEEKLDADLPRTLADDGSVYDRIADGAVAKSIYANGTPELWAAMCESGSPLVSLLGFRCVTEKSQNGTFRRALAVLAHRGSASLELFAKPLLVVNEASPIRDNKKVFSDFVTNPKHVELKLDDVTAFLNEHFLCDWPATAELETVPAKVQSLAVSAVYAKNIEDGTALPPSVAKLFDSFDKSSGDRLAVFVHYAPPTTESGRVKAAIERLLQDDEVGIGPYQLALSKQFDFIDAHVDFNTLKLKPQYQQRYDRMRQSAANRKRG